MFLMRSQFHRVERMLSTTVAYSWGIGTSGELGHANFKKETSIAGDIYVQITPRKILKSKRFTTFAVGSKYSIALDTEGRLFHWGQSPTAKFQSNEPTLLDDSVRYKKISCGPTHAAAIDADGSVYTWGSNGSALFNLSFFGAGGYLGHGNTSPQEKPKRIEFLVKYGSKAEDIVCGGRHTVIRTVDGELLSCGIGEYGRLGTGNSDDALEPCPLDTLVEDDIIQVAAGSSHTLAVSKDNKLFVWGRNDYGQLGFEDSYMDMYSLEDLPRHLDSDALRSKEIKSILAGRARSGVVTTDGELYIWGHRASHFPTIVSPKFFDGLKVKSASFGGDIMSNSCMSIITEDDGLWTFGDAGSNMIGRPLAIAQNQFSRIPEPSRVPALIGKKVTNAYMGSGQHIIATIEASDSAGEEA